MAEHGLVLVCRGSGHVYPLHINEVKMNDLHQGAWTVLRLPKSEILAALHRATCGNNLFDINQWSEDEITTLEKITKFVKDERAKLPIRSSENQNQEASCQKIKT